MDVRNDLIYLNESRFLSNKQFSPHGKYVSIRMTHDGGNRFYRGVCHAFICFDRRNGFVEPSNSATIFNLRLLNVSMRASYLMTIVKSEFHVHPKYARIRCPSRSVHNYIEICINVVTNE